MPTFIEVARGTGLFGGLDEAQLRSVEARTERIETRDGQVIFYEGDAPDRLYVIGSGSVRIGKGPGVRPSPCARFLATLEPGEVFGEMALVMNQPRSATSVAASTCELHALSRAAFDELLCQESEIAAKLLRNLVTLLCTRLQRADDAIIGIQDRSGAGSIGPADFNAVHASMFRGAGWAP